MKIRNGFVSNSSSSSFHIYGTLLYEPELRKIMIQKYIATEEEIDKYSVCEFFGDLEILYDEETVESDLVFFFDSDNNAAYFGKEYCAMKDDETPREFKKAVTDKVTSFLGKEIECEQIEDTIYN